MVGFLSAQEPGLDRDIFCLLCCLLETAAPQPALWSPGFLCLPHPHECVCRTPAPYVVCWWMSPAALQAAPGTEVGGNPRPARSPQSMPAPACTLGGEGEIPLLSESWRVPTSAVRSGVQASPFTSAGATAAQLGMGAARVPQAGRIRARLLPWPGTAHAAGHTDVACCLPLL